jgi:hypothetical protein
MNGVDSVGDNGAHMAVSSFTSGMAASGSSSSGTSKDMNVTSCSGTKNMVSSGGGGSGSSMSKSGHVSINADLEGIATATATATATAVDEAGSSSNSDDDEGEGEVEGVSSKGKNWVQKHLQGKLTYMPHSFLIPVDFKL